MKPKAIASYKKLTNKVKMAALIAMIIILTLAIYLIYLFYYRIPVNMARRRGRDEVAWVIIGIITTPFWAIVLLWILGDSRYKRNQY